MLPKMGLNQVLLLSTAESTIPVNMEILPLPRGLVSRVGPYSGEAVHSWDLATRRARNNSVCVRLLDVGLSILWLL